MIDGIEGCTEIGGFGRFNAYMAATPVVFAVSSVPAVYAVTNLK